jgi:hypothetical protein
MKLMEKVNSNLSKKIYRQSLILKKNSPHIAFGVGVAGVLAGTVLACKATLKLSGSYETFKDEVSDVKAHSPESDRNRDLAHVYARNALLVTKAYGPSAFVMGLSIAALTGSHVELTKRNKALTAAYVTLQKAYDEYRIRVREKYGEETELDIYHAVKEDNTRSKEVVKNKLADPNKFSPYARFFDEASSEWTKDPEMNRLFVTCQQQYLNHVLQVRGHVFLNEAYDALGLERSTAGAVVGWVIGDEGDNYIDFGIFEAQNARFVNGSERSILLDFNVDGVIYDKIGRRK